jgi:hypothetical protein
MDREQSTNNLPVVLGMNIRELERVLRWAGWTKSQADRETHLLKQSRPAVCLYSTSAKI